MTTTGSLKNKITAYNTDGIIHKLVTVFAFAPTPLTDL
jgi:hypothetical protein